MNVQYVPRVTTKNPDRHNASDALSGRWLLLARVVWIAIFVLTLVVFCANLIVGNYSLVTTILLVVDTSVWFAVSLVLFWRKSTDWNILLISLGLVVLGGVTIQPYPTALIQQNLWVWGVPILFLEFLAQTALIIFYIFPDGRFIPRWTRWLALGWTALSLVTNLPVIIPGAFYPWNWWSSPLFTLVRIAFFGSLALALLYRYRWVSTPGQRQQIKWVVFASTIILVEVSVASLVLSVVPTYFPTLGLSDQLNQLVGSIAFFLLPVLFPLSIGIALLRYRLWDVDVIIKRTLVYTVLTGSLVVVYIAFILLSQTLLSRFTSGNTLALVGSTLAIAALFQPFRRRIQTIIDRRFYRRKYDAARTIEAFNATLRGEVDLNTLSEQLLGVVQETMQPVHVSLWLQQHGRQAQQQYGGLPTAEKAPSGEPISPVSETEVTETSEEMPGPPSSRITRRAVILGLAAGGIAIAGGGLAWWLLRARTIFTYTGHSDWVYDAAWSPDGTRLASCSKDKTVQIWDASDGSHVFTYRGHTADVYTVVWSPDGKRLASCSKDKTVQVWDASDGSHVFTYRGHKDQVIMVAWSPDGKRLASGGGDRDETNKASDTTVQVWDAADGSHVFTYRGHTDSVEAVVWSPDGKRIASASLDKTVQVWGAADGSHVFTYRGHYDVVKTVAWNPVWGTGMPDGKRIASGSGDKTVQVWNAADGGHVFTYTGHTDWVNAVAWSPGGKRIASGSSDWTAQVWDAADGANVFVYNGHTGGVITTAWSPDGTRVASSSYDRTVQIWSPG